MEPELIRELSGLTSEARNPDTLDIDLLPTPEILRKINRADREVPRAVGRVLPQKPMSG